MEVRRILPFVVRRLPELRADGGLGEDAGLLVRVVLASLRGVECPFQMDARIRIGIERAAIGLQERGSGGYVDWSARRHVRVVIVVVVVIELAE